jgi:cation transport regulator ChaB
MPYSCNADLPKSVRDHMSLGAQTSYRKACNLALAAELDELAQCKRLFERIRVEHFPRAGEALEL